MPVNFKLQGRPIAEGRLRPREKRFDPFTGNGERIISFEIKLNSLFGKGTLGRGFGFDLNSPLLVEVPESFNRSGEKTVSPFCIQPHWKEVVPRKAALLNVLK